MKPTTYCEHCKSPLPDPIGIDLLAFQLRNAYWAKDFLNGVFPPAWQLLDIEEQDRWRCVANFAQAQFNIEVEEP